MVQEIEKRVVSMIEQQKKTIEKETRISSSFDE